MLTQLSLWLEKLTLHDAVMHLELLTCTCFTCCSCVIYRGWWNRGCLEDDRNAPTSVTSLCEFPDLLCTARWLGCTAPSKKCKKGVLWSHWFCCRSRRWNVSPWFRWMILTHRASWSVVLSKIKSLLQWGDLRQTRTSYYGTLLKFVKFGHGCS